MSLQRQRTIIKHQLKSLCASEYRWERLSLPPVHIQFHRQAAADPTLPCLWYEGDAMTFGNVAAAVRAFTTTILSSPSIPIPERSHIGVYVPKSYEYVIATLSVLSANCVYVPLDPALPLGRLQVCASCADLSAVVALEEDAEVGQQVADAATCPLIIIPKAHNLVFANAPIDGALLHPTPAEEIPAYMIFTSGTTGQPKGVVCHHLGLSDAIDEHAERLQCKPGTVFELTHSSSFDAHLYPLFCPLVTGAMMALCRPGGQVDPPYWVRFLQSARVDFVHSVPTPSAAYVDELSQNWSEQDREAIAVREWDCIGEPFPSKLALSLGSLLPGMHNTGSCINAYGPTESTIAVTHSRVSTRTPTTVVTVGRPDANVHCYVVDPATLLPVNPGEKGELLLSGPRLALEYYKQEDKTNNAFIPNPCIDWIGDLGIPEQYRRYYSRAYRTGDLAQWQLPSGLLLIHGRIDRQVKIRGVRFELGEVEATLQAAPGVVAATAAVRQDPRVLMQAGGAGGGDAKRLVAWVMPDTVDVGACLEHCMQVLMPAAVPAAIIAMKEFPTTGSGKVDEKRLPDPVAWSLLLDNGDGGGGGGGGGNSGHIGVSPSVKASPVSVITGETAEQVVTRVWQQVLQLSRPLQGKSDFFMEGGTSLSALRANAAIAEALGLSMPLPVTMLYRTRTLRATVDAVLDLIQQQQEQQEEEDEEAEDRLKPGTNKPKGGKQKQKQQAQIHLKKKHWVDNVRPLSPGQEQFWLLDSLARAEQHSAAYVVAAAFRITSNKGDNTNSNELNVDALEKALQGVAERHESLRMRYAVMPNGSIRGVVAPPKGIRIPLRRVTLASGASNESIEEAMREEMSLPFELETGPLMRALLLTIPSPSSSNANTIEWILVLSTHHSNSDNWSMGVLCRELSLLYRRACGDGDDDGGRELEELPVQYGDYAEALRIYLQFVSNDQLEYWKQALHNAPELLDLPTDRPRPAVLSAQGAMYFSERPLAPKLQLDLHHIAAQLKITHAALYLAAFHVLMAKLSGQDDVVVGLPVAQRYLPQVQGLIGNMINLLPIRVSGIAREAGFREVALRTQAAMADAMDHSEVPFQEMVRSLGASHGGDGSFNPVFQVMFQLQNDPPLELELGGGVGCVALRAPDLFVAPLDLFMEVSGVNGSISVQYSTVLFDKETISMMIDCYQTLLSSIAGMAPTAPSPTIKELNILSDAHRAEIDMYSTGQARDDLLYGPVVHEQFRELAREKAAHRRCLIHGATLEVMTYSEVMQCADALSMELLQNGKLNKGGVVGVMIGRSFELVVAMVAVLQAGCVYLPLDPGYPVGRLAGYIEDAKPAIVLVDGSLTGEDGEGGGGESGPRTSVQQMVYAILLGQQSTSSSTPSASRMNEKDLPAVLAVDLTTLQQQHQSVVELPKVDDDSVAVIIFTSGSTGRPKGAELPHRGLKDLAGSSYRDLLGCTADDVYTLVASIGFDPHLGNTWGALTTGAALAIVPPGLETDAPFVATMCANVGVTVLEQVPSLMRYYIHEFDAEKMSTLRVALMGGELLTSQLVCELQKKIPSLRDGYGGVYNTYGPTEFTVNSTTCLMPTFPTTQPSLGPPDPNVRAYVVHPEDCSQLQPIGVPGELLLSGPRLAKGYVGRPDLTQERFVPNPFLNATTAMEKKLYSRVYKTGDLVVWESSSGEGGTLKYLGRADRQVKVSGVRIELGEIEAAMLGGGGEGGEVESAVATAMYTTSKQTKSGGDKVVVGVVTPTTVNVNVVIAHCRQVLMAAAVPTRIVAVDSLPLLPSGKVDTKAVEQLVTSSDSTDTGEGKVGGRRHVNDEDWFVPPSTDLEVTIQKVWAQVLDVDEEDLSVELDFFKAGGSSLKAGVLTAGLRNILALPRLPATAVYQGKTVRGMAKMIEGISAHQNGSGGNGGDATTTNPNKGGGNVFTRVLSGGLGSGRMHHQGHGNRSRADDPKLELTSSQRVVATKLPYALYLPIQFIMLSITMLLIPVIWGLLLVALFALRPLVGIWALVGLWPAMQLGALFGYAFLLVVFKWVLVGRLKEGVYPLHGWMWARWITLRALQEQAGAIFLPAIRRTPLMPLLLRLLGASIEDASDTLIDSMSIYDFDLIRIGKGACIYEEVSVTAGFVAPAGYLAPTPVLVLSPVDIGRGCHLGHRSVVTGGTTIPEYHNLKPHASPVHPGDAPVAGPLADFPHFTPEERMSLPLAMIGGTLVHIIGSLIEIPSIALALYIIHVALGDVPLVSGNTEHDAGKLVAFAVLFTALFGWFEYIFGMVLHALVVIVWKWTTLGRLGRGRDLCASTWTLLCYSILRRLTETQEWEHIQSLLTGTPLMGALYRVLGATVGREVLIGGLSVVEFDAIEVADYGCSGSDARVYATDDDGIIVGIHMQQEATVGNGSVIFPGAVIGKRAVVGNDTPICMGREVPADTRVQGSIEYAVVRRSTGDSVSSLEAGLPAVVKASADGVVGVHLFWGHTAVVLSILCVTAPVAPFCLWAPIAIVATLVKATLWWLIFIGYPIMVGVGVVCSVLWLRVLFHISGIRSLMKAGYASVFDVRAQLIHGNFTPESARLEVFGGTPFAVWIWRGLGFRVEEGAVLMGPFPFEPPMVKIGKDSVVEAGAKLDGHYLEFLKFIFHDVELHQGCWVQEGARVMPATVMHQGARVLPGSMVLPGDTLDERMIWGGLPAEPIGRREVGVGEGGRRRRRLLRSERIGSRARRHKTKATMGMGGFLGVLASKKIVSKFKGTLKHGMNGMHGMGVPPPVGSSDSGKS